MASDKDQLIDMGFDAARVDWALQATNRAGLQPAMDHIINNMDNPIPSTSSSTPGSTETPSGSTPQTADDLDDDDRAALAIHVAKINAGAGGAGAGGAGTGSASSTGDDMAKSVKCSDCGKVFRNASLVSFHAEKSGHSNFEESTEEFIPLTEEQKKERLADLRQKLAEKRAKQSGEDAVANKANEALRRKAGQDQGKAKLALQQKEMEKDLAQKKKDKLDDAKAKAAIKAQIEADKKSRAEKAARDKAIRAGEQPAVVNDSGPISVAKPATLAGKSGDQAETRLQVRLSKPGVQPMIKTFPSSSPLSEVAEWVASEHLEYDVSTIKFSTTFPRKVYTPADMGKSLKENGLTPSAVLMAA